MKHLLSLGLMTGCALVMAAACSNTKVKKKPVGGTAGAFEGGLEGGGGYGGLGGSGGLDAGPDVVDAAQEAQPEAAPPPPPLFFSVSPGAQGQPGTGVAQQTSPAGAVYGSAGAAISHTAGNNILVVSATGLGLASSDDIDAIAVKKPVPAHPFYYFSVAGAQSSSVAGDVTFVAKTHEERGDVFISDGTLFTNTGDGVSYLGHNGVFATGVSVGLGPHTLAAGADAGTAGAGGAGTGGSGGTAGGGAVGTTIVDDNLDALEMDVTAANAATAYFSVAPDATGAAGSAVAATPANERGCTLYASDRDGKNRVVYSCAQLGLEPGDNIDALAVFDLGTATRIYFSVDQSSQGAAGTVVRSRHDQSMNQPTPYAADIYSSDGSFDNQLVVDGTGLGLDVSVDVDGLAVRNVSRPPLYLPSSTCTLTPSPFGDAGTGQFYQLGQLSGSLVLMETFGPVPTASVYDLSTCKLVGTPAALSTSYNGSTFVAVPRAGWSAAQPLSNLDVWSFTHSFSGNAFTVVQQDASTGQTLATYSGSVPNLLGMQVAYNPATKQFVITGSIQSNDNGMLLIDVPQGGSDAGVAALPALAVVPTSCSYDFPNAIGIDPATGVLETAKVASPFTSPPDAIVCRLSPDGYPAQPYRSWNDGSIGQQGRGVVVPGQALYMTTQNGSDVTVTTFTPLTTGNPADAGPG